MFTQQRIRFWKLMFRTCLIIIGGVLISCGFANAQKTLDRVISGPQVIVNPESIRLAVSKLKSTDIIFEGSGFKAGDSIFITLIGERDVKAIVAEAPIQPDGTFKAKVADLTKFMEIMRADIVFNEKFQSIVVISQPPIPKGVYKAKVTSMLSKLTAETKLTVKGPTVIDRLKDWIGGLTGKIQHKKAKENQQPGSNFQNSIKGSMVILLPRNGGMLLNINGGTQQLTGRYQTFFLARPHRQCLRSGGSG